MREKAEDTLETFAGVVSQFGLYAGTYGLALERLLLPPVQVVVIGEDAVADELEAAALVGYAVNKSVLHLTRGQATGALPAIAGRNPSFAPEPEGKTKVLPWSAREPLACRR